MPRIAFLVVTCLSMTWPGFFAGCTVHVDESAEPARHKVDVDVRPKPNVEVDVDVKPKP